MLKTIYITIVWTKQNANVLFADQVKRIFDDRETTKEKVASEELEMACNRAAIAFGVSPYEIAKDMEVTISDKKRK